MLTLCQMVIKKIIVLFAVMFGMLGLPLFAGKITMQASYSDTRFPPVDMFHAGCVQDAQMLFEGKDKNISKIHLELEYNPGELEISRIVWADQVIANYRIEYDRVIFDIDNPKIQDIASLFDLSFQSKTAVASSDILITTWSYFVSNGKIIYLNQLFTLQFADVPECDPDVIAPSVRLVFPKDSTARLALDNYFMREIKDDGKWIDKQDVTVIFNDIAYTADSPNLKWKGNYLTFYPADWLPINKKVSLQLTVGDLQSYGGANTTDKTFSFKTATGMVLLNPIDPLTFRQLAQEGQKLAGTTEECDLLGNFYARSDASFQAGLTPILAKLSCDITSLDTENIHGAAPTQTKSMVWISVFASLGRILFVIALALKFHYIALYYKHKKLAKTYKERA